MNRNVVFIEQLDKSPKNMKVLLLGNNLSQKSTRRIKRRNNLKLIVGFLPFFKSLSWTRVHFSSSSYLKIPLHFDRANYSSNLFVLTKTSKIIRRSKIKLAKWSKVLTFDQNRLIKKSFHGEYFKAKDLFLNRPLVLSVECWLMESAKML